MEKVTLNNKEQKRLIVLNEVLLGRVTGQEAAEMLGNTSAAGGISTARGVGAGSWQPGAVASQQVGGSGGGRDLGSSTG
jgi:hypothetical protein